MPASESDNILAEPGDPDLTCDIQETVVQSVVSFNDNELIVTFAGGSGLLHVDGTPQRWDSFSEIEVWGGFADHPENRSLLTMMIDVLEEWRREGTKVSLYSAPGRMTTVVENRETWIPLPCGALGT
jgi:hypothetical protein